MGAYVRLYWYKVNLHLVFEPDPRKSGSCSDVTHYMSSSDKLLLDVSTNLICSCVCQN